MDYILDSLINLFFLSIPQTFIYLMFSFLFWGLALEHYAARLFWTSALHSLYLHIMADVIPASVHILHSLLAFALLFSWIFRSLSLQAKLAIQITFIVSVICSDLVAFLIGSSVFDSMSLQNTNVWDRLLLHWPLFMMVSAIGWLLHRRACYPGLKMKAFLKSKHHRPIFLFCVLILIQAMTLTTYFFSRYFTRYDQITKLLFYIGLCSTVFVSFMAIRLIFKTREEAITATRSVYVSDVMQMLTSIRGQRHDFF